MITFFSMVFMIMLVCGIVAIPVLLVLSVLFDKPRKPDPVVDEIRRQRALNYYNNPADRGLKNKS